MGLKIYPLRPQAEEVCKAKNRTARKYKYKVVQRPAWGYLVMREDMIRAQRKKGWIR